MPIIFEEGQTVVEFTGDILVIPFDPEQKPLHDVGFILFQERRQGKIGKVPEPKEVDSKMCLHEQPGVVFSADNYKSLDVVIKQLLEVRNQLKNLEDKRKRKKIFEERPLE